MSNDDVHPGWLTLYVKDRTTASLGAQVVVAKMRPGYPVSRLVADINVQVNQNSTPAQGAASTSDINKIAVALGGADTFGTSTFFRSDTIRLPSDGVYYILNTSAKNGVDVVGDIEARGRVQNDRDSLDHSGTISLGNGTADTITLRGQLPTTGTVKVRNNGDSVHLLAISKVAKGVTDAQVQAEYDNLMMGIFPTPGNDPANLMGAPAPATGSDAISPGHASYLSYHLPKGTYLLQCFVDDSTTGIPHAFMGMHLIVHIG
ncbi:MAG: hypothetical protein M3Y42_19275 [Actinomycetota bacterium]|nr:hypothetical protein [Actinomycetota bacterium]